MCDYSAWKQQVLECSLRLTRRGIFVGTGGNVSVKIPCEDKIAVTPSGKDYLALTAGDICIVDFAGNLVEGEFRPSVESGMHISVYKKRLDVGALVHTHQVGASTFAVMNMPIPSLFDEQVANLGIEVAVVPYGLSGSKELLENVAETVGNNCNAFIMQNHGVLLLGMNLAEAERNVGLLEKTAMVYYRTLASGKELSTLPDDIAGMLMEILKAKQANEINRRKETGEV